MKYNNEQIFFDDEIMDFNDLNFDLEHEFQIKEEKKEEEPKQKIIKQSKNSLGLTEDEMETFLAILVGILFNILFVGGLVWYMTWYFKQ